MNEAWKSADAEAHAAKAEALDNAIRTLDGLAGILDPIETPVIGNTLELLRRARDLHENAAKLQAVA